MSSYCLLISCKISQKNCNSLINVHNNIPRNLPAVLCPRHNGALHDRDGNRCRRPRHRRHGDGGREGGDNRIQGCYIYKRCRWVAANPRMTGGRSAGCRNGADRDRCVTSSSIKDRWMAAESQWIWMVLTVIWTKITMMVKKSSVF